jgi:hypothetical protein
METETETICEECEAPQSVRTLHHTCNLDPYRNKACKEPACTNFICDDCADAANERADQASLADYYGGSGPQTDREIQLATYAQKSALKGGR